MKHIIIRILGLTLLLACVESVPVLNGQGGFPAPTCFPGEPGCPNGK
jgi:hypothetical protein